MLRCTPVLIAALLVGCSVETPAPNTSSEPSPAPTPATGDESTVTQTSSSDEIAAVTEPVDVEESIAITPSVPETPAIDPEIAAFLEGDEQLRARLDPLLASPTLPAFSLTDWHNSEPLDWSQLEGKLVLLDFWATWCGPCIGSIPHTNELAERYAGEVVIIGVCAPNGAENLVSTIEEHSIQYPVAVDDGSAWNNHFEVNGFPDYYLIGRNGELLAADVANSQVDAALAYFLSR